MYSRMQQDLAQTSRQAAENESRYVQLEQALARSEMQSQSARAERDELQKSAERLRSEASAIQKDAQSAMSQLETRFAETSRRMIAEKEELASQAEFVTKVRIAYGTLRNQTLRRQHKLEQLEEKLRQKKKLNLTLFFQSLDQIK